MSFELPIGGLLSVASGWTQWRFNERGRVVPRRAGDAQQGIGVAIQGDGIDQHSDGNHEQGHQRFFSADGVHLLMLHYDGPPPNCRNSAAMLTVSAGATVPTHLVEAFDEKLQQDQRSFDFVYRAGERRWVVVWDCDDLSIPERIESVTIVNDAGHRRSVRLTWSPVRRLNLDSCNAAACLADTLAHVSLGEREPVGVVDDDMSSDGTTELPRSDIPESRLKTELSHLARRIKRQSQAIESSIARERQAAKNSS